MHQISRWTTAVAALCLTTACSDRQPTTAPSVPTNATAALVSNAMCQDELNSLRAAIGAAAFIGQKAESDEASLLAKLDAAEAKLAEGKTADAMAKLIDMQTTVINLSTAAKPKLTEASAAAINGAITDVLRCLEPPAAPPTA